MRDAGLHNGNIVIIEKSLKQADGKKFGFIDDSYITPT